MEKNSGKPATYFSGRKQRLPVFHHLVHNNYPFVVKYLKRAYKQRGRCSHILLSAAIRTRCQSKGHERGPSQVKRALNVEILRQEAAAFGKAESLHSEPVLYGVTDGKAVGTYLEHKFTRYLQERYDFAIGNSAKGIDFPELGVDLKVTSVEHPQSYCPFKSARQKIYGLGYALLMFVYEKSDDNENKAGRLNILHTIFVAASRTADYQTTTGLRHILNNKGNEDDLFAFLEERMLPVDSIEAKNIVEEVMKTPPEVGYLTISSALQWRLMYSRVITEAGTVEGVMKIS